jgi:hypothetical protein
MEDLNLAEKKKNIEKEFIETIHKVFISLNNKGKSTNNQKLGLICMTIFKYLKEKIVLSGFKEGELSLPMDSVDTINLVPFFTYLRDNDITVLNFEELEMNQINITKFKDVERFVLSHIYYLTQK